MASRPLRLLKLDQEVSIGGLLLVKSAILLVAMHVGASVVIFRSGVELAISAWKRAWGMHGDFRVIYGTR
jgi:hypothetical protein